MRNRTSRGLRSEGSLRTGERPDSLTAVVIGAGFGGLAMAVRLQAAGVRTHIIEKRPLVGGRAYRYEDKGYLFDMGPSLLAAPGIVESVFRAAGRPMTDYVDLIRLDPYYRVHFPDGARLDYVGEPERMKEQMRALCPRDADRLDDFLDDVRPIYEAVVRERLGSRAFDSATKAISVLPRMIRWRALHDVTSFVDGYFEDPRHRFLFSLHPLFIGGNPLRTPALYLMIPVLESQGGVWFPRGGMYALVRALRELFTELGGALSTGVEVTRVEVRDGRAVGVRVGDEVIPADLVVSNADVGHTYRELVSAKARHHWTKRRLDHAEYSMSCFMLYLGVCRKYPGLAHNTLVLGGEYRELLRSLFDEKTLARDLSLWVHAPTVTDPRMAPDGCECLHVIVPVPNNESGLDWSKHGPRFAQRVIAFLEAWGLSELRENTQVMRTFTPTDFETELNATAGAAFSMEPRLTQTGWFRPHSRSEDVDGLYLVGAGTHPGAGVPAVLMSAEAAYQCVASDFGLPPAPDRDQPGAAAMSGTES